MVVAAATDGSRVTALDPTTHRDLEASAVADLMRRMVGATTRRRDRGGYVTGRAQRDCGRLAAHAAPPATGVVTRVAARPSPSGETFPRRVVRRTVVEQSPRYRTAGTPRGHGHRWRLAVCWTSRAATPSGEINALTKTLTSTDARVTEAASQQSRPASAQSVPHPARRTRDRAHPRTRGRYGRSPRVGVRPGPAPRGTDGARPPRTHRDRPRPRPRTRRRASGVEVDRTLRVAHVKRVRHRRGQQRVRALPWPDHHRTAVTEREGCRVPIGSASAARSRRGCDHIAVGQPSTGRHQTSWPDRESAGQQDRAAHESRHRPARRAHNPEVAGRLRYHGVSTKVLTCE